MPDQEQFETGQSIRTLERGGKDAVIVLEEYGGCHIDISSDHRLLIKRIFGV